MGDGRLRYFEAVLDVAGAHSVGLIDGALSTLSQHTEDLSSMRIGDGAQPDA